MDIPEPIFENKLKNILWKKIYSREYGVQYSEMAILCLSNKAKHHIPKPSNYQVVIPEDNNTAFYVDSVSWVELVESLNKKYTSNIKQLEQYERQFIHNGKAYLNAAEKIKKINFKDLSNKVIKDIYLEYQNKLFHYSVFVWTAFILNNYVSERATAILDHYIQKHDKFNNRQFFIDSLFKPVKKAAVLELQEKVEKHNGKLSATIFEKLFNKFKWLSCLDIHNKPWTKKEFKEHIKSFTTTTKKHTQSLSKISKELKIKLSDLKYLEMAKRFVYIKDARDDFRRQGVYHARPLFNELAKRMNIVLTDISYLQQAEIISFLDSKTKILKESIIYREKGFVLYLDNNISPVCVTDKSVISTLKKFNLLFSVEKETELYGNVASRGMATGKVVIIRGVKDLHKVQKGDILVAVSTHPDYVPVMRKSAAIVTDEGGITCHAAIISREFGIPCIVGTKNATSFLKDGDIIEVNAIDGWVKKL